MDAFLFDLDGLLVDSEPLHFEAFMSVCAQKGFPMDWDFELYCKKAHTQSLGLKKAFLDQFPEGEAVWPELYQEIKEGFSKLVLERPLPLVQGVDAFLDLLQKKNKKRAVVTNSSVPMVKAIRARQPVLEKIPLWITREDYVRAKPNPDGYLKALEILEVLPANTVGFEDSPRGLMALRQAGILAIHIHPAGWNEPLYYANFTKLLEDPLFMEKLL